MESTPNKSNSSNSSNDPNKISNSSTDSNVSHEITCLGCRDGILNQLGHVDQGGCLYEEYTYINESS